MNKISDDDLDLVIGGMQGYPNGKGVDKTKLFDKYKKTYKQTGTIGLSDTDDDNFVSKTPIGDNPNLKFFNRAGNSIETA